MIPFPQFPESPAEHVTEATDAERSYYEALDAVQYPIHEFLSTPAGYVVKVAAWAVAVMAVVMCNAIVWCCSASRRRR